MSDKSTQGSIGLTLVASIAAISLALAFTESSNSKLRSQLKESKAKNQIDSSNISKMSALSRYRALLSTSLSTAGTYAPVLYPSNYFDVVWNLKKNPLFAGAVAQVSGPTTGIDVMKNATVDVKDLGNIFSGSSSGAMPTEKAKVNLLKVNFSSTKKALAESVDVEVTTEKSSPIRARIPISSPFGTKPILEVSPKGSNSWSRNFTDLPAAEYDFRVLASGIVFKAEISVNGSVFTEIGGFDPVSGKITHNAVNIDAVDEEIGRFNLPVVAGTTSGVATATAAGEKLVGNSATCDVVRASSGTGSGTVTTTTTTPTSATIKIQLIAPDETPIPEAFVEVAINAAAPVASAPVAAADGKIDEQTFADVCQAECPFLPDPAMDELRRQQVITRNFTDYSASHIYRESNAYTAQGFKVCENIKSAVESYFAQPNAQPVTANALVQDHMTDQWFLVEFRAYQAPACKPEFLFERQYCGCFSDDTLIRLENGSEKRISDLTQTDRVWNPITKKSQNIKRMTRGPETIPLILITSAEKKVVVTQTHPFLTAEGVKPANALYVGQQMKQTDGSWAIIDSIESVPVPEVAPIVWNLELEGAEDDEQHYVEANGIVAGDLYLQNKLMANPQP